MYMCMYMYMYMYNEFRETKMCNKLRNTLSFNDEMIVDLI